MARAQIRFKNSKKKKQKVYKFLNRMWSTGNSIVLVYFVEKIILETLINTNIELERGYYTNKNNR